MLTCSLLVLALGTIATGLTRTHSSEQRLLSIDSSQVLAQTWCTKNELIFPPSFDAVVQLPSVVHTKGIVLPMDGALILAKTAQLMLLPESQTPCDKENAKEIAGIIKPKHLNWFDPKSWPTSQQDEVKSVPDVERIPCSGDKIWMTAKSAFSIDLDDVRSLSVGEVSLDGREVSAEGLQDFLNTELGQIMFKSTDGTKVQTGLKSVCGCHAVEDIAEYEYKVCSHLTESCPIPKCMNPIVPLGFCCPVCGATFRMFANDCSSFDEDAFDGRVKLLTTQLKLDDKISGYGSLIREGERIFYQYVVLDSGDYNEDSVRFVTELQRLLATSKHEVQYSGKFYYPASGFSSWEIILSTLLAVTAFFFVLYAYYERDVLSSIALPSWLAVNRYRIFHSSFVFARFDNHPAGDADADGDVEVPGNVVIGLGEDNDGFRARDERGPLATGTSTSFHNPMFSEKEIKSTTTTTTSTAALGSSRANAGSNSTTLKDDKESVLAVAKRRQHVDNVATEDDDEEELVEVDLGSEVSSTSE